MAIQVEGVEQRTGRDVAGLTGIGVAAVSSGVGVLMFGANAAAASGSSVMIGETMTRVVPAATAVGAKTFQASDQALRRGPRSIWAENRVWLEAAVQRGERVYDIGRDAARAVGSRFYRAEKLLLEKLGVTSTPVK